jgi:hypothetical protein
MEIHEFLEDDVDYTLYGRRRVRATQEPIAVDLSPFPQRTMTAPLDQKLLRNWMLNRDRLRAEPRIRQYVAWERRPEERPHLLRRVNRRR